MRPAGDVPTLGVLVTGGIGVLVVLAFVGGLALGRQSRIQPGDRVAVAAPTEPGRPPVVFVGRCPDERVRAVEIRVPDGETLWRVESARGTIDRAFIVGEEPPAFFATVVEARPFPPGELEVLAQVDDTLDRERFDPAVLRQGEGPGVACGDSDLGLVPLLFLVGAAGVVAAYAAMVMRYVRAR